jgi:hypothetical protein
VRVCDQVSILYVMPLLVVWTGQLDGFVSEGLQLRRLSLIACPVLRNDVDIDFRGLFKKVLNRPVVQIFTPPA